MTRSRSMALFCHTLGGYSDAYASPGPRPRWKPIQDAAFCIGVAFLSQATLLIANGQWAVPWPIMIWGGGASVLLVATLRMLFPPDSRRPRGATW